LFQRIREVSAAIALAVAEEAYRLGLARRPRPADLLSAIKNSMYEPVYRNYEARRNGGASSLRTGRTFGG
jgi:malic enzyme